MRTETILIFGTMFLLIALQVVLQWNQIAGTRPWYLRKMIYDSLWLVFMAVLGVITALTGHAWFSLMYAGVIVLGTVSFRWSLGSYLQTSEE